MRRRATAPMQDTKKTKKQLIQELVALRQQLAACEAFHRQHQQTADALPESEAHFAGDIGSCIDITERKQMEAALREMVIHDTGHGIAPASPRYDRADSFTGILQVLCR
jgi:hypothetical protein